MDPGRLLRFARDLQRANDFDELLACIHAEVAAVAGYENVWLAVFEPDLKSARVLAFTGAAAKTNWEKLVQIPLEGDLMMLEILHAESPVVVLDAREDPRTNKEIVARLGNRTIINVPIPWLDSALGSLGMGTFGDEGPRPPTKEALDQVVAMASLVSVAVARLRWRAEHERLEREQAEVQRRVLVAQKLEAVGALAGGVAHDLNNLLQLVIMSADVLSDTMLDGDQRADLESIRSASERAAGLVRKLLGLARPQPEKLSVVDLHERLEELARLFERTFPESIFIEVTLGASNPRCVGDEVQLDQVFTNLCVNARDAMPTGGRLFIETRDVVFDEAAAASHPGMQPGPHVLVSIRDTGVGMPPEVLDRVFEPYFTTKAQGRGTGLGLAVAHGVVRQHLGSLEAESEVGIGTTMRVLLPVRSEAQLAERPLELRGPAPLGRERILVAEDEPAVRAATVRILAHAGYSVLSAADGAEAVTVAAREPIDLVILDAIMPKLSGTQAFQQIRELRPGAAFLFATGYAPELAIDLPEGMTVEVLQKPFQSGALLRAVRRALERGRP